MAVSFIGGGNRSTASHWQTISHNVVWSTSHWMLVVVGTDCIGSYKSNYHMITTAPTSILSLLYDYKDIYTCIMIKLFAYIRLSIISNPSYSVWSFFHSHTRKSSFKLLCWWWCPIWLCWWRYRTSSWRWPLLLLYNGSLLLRCLTCWWCWRFSTSACTPGKKWSKLQHTTQFIAKTYFKGYLNTNEQFWPHTFFHLILAI